MSGVIPCDKWTDVSKFVQITKVVHIGSKNTKAHMKWASELIAGYPNLGVYHAVALEIDFLRELSRVKREFLMLL